jgi:hypothetical protein
MVDLIKLTNLLDEAKCYEVIRQLRWPDGVVCLHCRGTGVVRNGHDDRERDRQRYGLGQFPRQVGRVRQVDSGAFRTAGDMIRC